MYYATIRKDWNSNDYVKQPIKKAYPFNWKGIQFIAHRSFVYDKSWQVTEPKTGARVPLSTSQVVPTKKFAVNLAIATLEQVGRAKTLEAIRTLKARA